MVSHHRGFTLVAVAILLVIVGLIAAGGLGVINPLIDGGRASTTKKRMDMVENAIQSYVEQYGCLPCPANGTTASTNAAAGSSAANAGTYTTGCATAVCDVSTSAVVPWRTLGLAEEIAIDGWGNRMRYDVANAGTPCATAELWGATGMMRCTTSTYPAGGISVDDFDTAASTDISNAAYVLFSSGPDESLALTSTTGVLTSNVYGQAGGDPQFDNTYGSETYYSGSVISVSGTTHFDDIVRYKTAPIIVQKCGPGLCGNPSEFY